MKWINCSISILLIVVSQTAYSQDALIRRADPLIFHTEIDGNPAQVEIFLAPGADSAAAVERLSALGSSPAISDPTEFVAEGYVWFQFLDNGRHNDFVTQSYNPIGDPTGGAALVALQHAQQSWSDVQGSTFRFVFDGTTTRSPSLVCIL